MGNVHLLWITRNDLQKLREKKNERKSSRERENILSRAILSEMFAWMTVRSRKHTRTAHMPLLS